MTVAHADTAPPRRSYGTIVVVGGGCYGRYYVRQLARARAAGALAYQRVLVVDRDPACAVTTELARSELPDTGLMVAEWDTFFDRYLGAAAPDAGDAIVPSPLMPHVMYHWLRRRAAARWPHRTVTTVPLPVAPPTPWRAAAPDGTAYASFATWTCPVNCIEPARCPHTRGPRDWTMPRAARDLAALAAAAGAPLAGPVIFHCTHRAYGVGMIDTRDVMRADAFVTSAAGPSGADVLVGTVSHCHGAFNVLRIGPEPVESPAASADFASGSSSRSSPRSSPRSSA